MTRIQFDTSTLADSHAVIDRGREGREEESGWEGGQSLQKTFEATRWTTVPGTHLGPTKLSDMRHKRWAVHGRCN